MLTADPRRTDQLVASERIFPRAQVNALSRNVVNHVHNVANQFSVINFGFTILKRRWSERTSLSVIVR